MQAGTVSIANSPTPSYRMWYEDYPYNPTPVYNGPVISPGNTVYVSVDYNGNSTADYFLENETTGNYTPVYNVTAPDYDGTSVDYIVEKPASSLPDFGSVPFSNAAFQSNTEGGYFGAFNDTPLTMVFTGSGCPAPSQDILAQPSSVSNQSNFTVTWKQE